MNSVYPLVPILNVLAGILVLVPLPWQLKSWNTGICMFAIWNSSMCFVVAVNAIVWRRGTENIAPVLCDITGRFQIAILTAIPACSLTINRRMFCITRDSRLATASSDKRREIIVDLLICVGLPFLIAALYTIVQTNRYAIYEDLGCAAIIVRTILSFFITDAPPIIVSLVSILYTPFILSSFLKRRKEMDQFHKSNTSFPRSVYVRIMIISCLDAFITLPTGVAYLCLDLFPINTIIRWPGWITVHAHISEIVTLSENEWDLSRRTDIIFVWYFYINVFWAVTFFVFFGFTYDMRRRYANFFWRVLSVVGVKRPVNGLGSSIRFANEVKTRPARRDAITFPTFLSSSSTDEEAIDTVDSRSLSDENVELQDHGKPVEKTPEEVQCTRSVSLQVYEDGGNVRLKNY